MDPLDRDDAYRAIGAAVWAYYRHRSIVRVRCAITSKFIPKASKLRCVDCGKRAEDYDHRNYARPLDVVPVCHRCNSARGPAELDPEVVLNHLRESASFPFENPRLLAMGVTRFQQPCVCCDDEKNRRHDHSEESLNYHLTINQ